MAISSVDSSVRAVRRTRALVAALIEVSRPVNACIACAGVATAGVIAGTPLAQWRFLAALSLGAVFFSAAANAVNDAFDAAIDSVNKPCRPVPSGRLTKAEAVWWAAAAASAALSLSAFAGMKAFAVGLTSAALMYGYSAWLKRIPLLGNVVVGLVTGMGFFFGASVAPTYDAVYIPAAFAFLYSIPREIIKDLEDIDGDRQAGVRTLPLRVGVGPSRSVAVVLLSGIVPLTVLPYALGVYNIAYAVIVLLGVDIPLLICIVILLRDSRKRAFAHVSTILKAGMAAGILAIAAGTF